MTEEQVSDFKLFISTTIHNAINAAFEEKFDEAFDRKFDEAFDRKFDEAFDRKFDEKISPIREDLQRIDQNVQDLADLVSGSIERSSDDIQDHEVRITRLEQKAA